MKNRVILTGLAAILAAAAYDVGPLKDYPAHRKELQERAGEYLKLRKEAVANLPKLKDKAEPEAIQAHKTAELEAIRAARADARQGDVLTPSIQQYLKKLVRSEMTHRSGRPAKDAAKTGNPTAEGPSTAVPVKVNAKYPDSASLSSVPPTLLLRLPQLPKELDFRFVGRHLVLRDVGAGMVVDYVPNAMP